MSQDRKLVSVPISESAFDGLKEHANKWPLGVDRPEWVTFSGYVEAAIQLMNEMPEALKLAALKECSRSEPYWIYFCLNDDGLMKLGRSGDLINRLKTHWRLDGLFPHVAILTGDERHAIHLENQLIEFYSEHYTQVDREYFKKVEFGEIIELAQEAKENGNEMIVSDAVIRMCNDFTWIDSMRLYEGFEYFYKPKVVFP